MSEAAPAFMFYAKDFMLGTVTMSLAERGAYITLLAYQWDNGSVPAGLAARARICGCALREVEKLWAIVGAKFQRGSDGLFRNARLETERRKQLERRGILTANGRKGGRPPRNLGETERLSEQEPKSEPTNEPNENQNKSLPIPIPVSVPEVRKANTAAAPPRAPKFPQHASHPADDGNFSVILKLAHDTMDASGLLDPADPELLAQLKDACGAAKIDYGRDVDPDVCIRALKSAARARSELIPARKANGGLSELVSELQDARDPETLGKRLRTMADRPRR